MTSMHCPRESFDEVRQAPTPMRAGSARYDGVVWPALTERDLVTFENALVPGHSRCSCVECRDAAALRDLAGIERQRRKHEGYKIVVE